MPTTNVMFEHQTLSASEFLHNLKRNSLPEHYTVEEEVQAEELDITCPVNFRSARFLQPFSLSKTIFREDVTINRVLFSSESSFAESRFMRDVHITNTNFRQSANFVGIACKDNFVFQANTVQAEALFQRANVWNSTSFSGTRLQGYTSFQGSHLQDVHLEGVVFDDHCDFVQTHFRDNASFDRATFHKTVCFDESVFAGLLSLANTAFRGTVYAQENPALLWLISQHRQHLGYTISDARCMCGHPRPMRGWKWDDSIQDYCYIG